MAIGDKKSVVMGFDKAAPNGVATLDANGNVPREQLGNVVNLNLLHNWYFVNPVNQRGKAMYDIANYTIDRWKKSNNGETVYVEDSCVKISAKENGYLIQTVENHTLFADKTVTLSALIKSTTGRAEVRIDDGKNTYIGHTYSAGLVTVTATLATDLTKILIELSAQNGISAEFIAAKLELGSTQTLAR